MWIDAPIPLKQCPDKPGVYQMLDKKGHVIYIGKARNLRKRLSSYFQSKPDSPRTTAMVQNIHDIQVIVRESEAEALLLEHDLIKQYQPRYNVIFKDQKSYPYIQISRHAYPRLSLYRGKQEPEKGSYYGPFPHARSVRELIHKLQPIFKFRDCDDHMFLHRSRPCMQYQIGRCSAPCCDLVSKAEYQQSISALNQLLSGKEKKVLNDWTKKMQQASDDLNFEQAAGLRDQIQQMQSILQITHQPDLPDDIDVLYVHRAQGSVQLYIGARRKARDLGYHPAKIDHTHQASDMDIIQAAIAELYSSEERSSNKPDTLLIHGENLDMGELKSMLRLARYGKGIALQQPQRGVLRQWLNHMHEQISASRSIRQGNLLEAFEKLASTLELNDTPEHIAAIDNAHFSGQHTASAIVYFGVDGPLKKFYRHYNVKGVKASDDYGTMEHVLTRYCKSLNDNTLPYPDLLIIDGGKGQLETAKGVFSEQGIQNVVLMGMAKGETRKFGNETLWCDWLNQPNGFHLSRHDPAMQLLGNVRNEAHRFSGKHHRKKQRKGMQQSILDGIEGIGKQKKVALLKEFGGLNGIKQASIDQLLQTRGISKPLAQRIFDALHKS